VQRVQRHPGAGPAVGAGFEQPGLLRQAPGALRRDDDGVVEAQVVELGAQHAGEGVERLHRGVGQVADLIRVALGETCD
jgi:hypothetical protein